MSSGISGDPNNPQPAGAPPARPRFSEIASDAIRYWEPRRALYNLALVAVVVGHFVASWHASRLHVSWETLFLLIMLAVLANVCYCAVYAVDLFVQYSGLRPEWARRRWIVLAIGIIFAGVITHFFTMGIFS